MKHFHFSQLKDWQLKVLQATIEGKNTLVIQPTGSGKSLCFQLPSLITSKVTLVLTPTISLMHDQTAGLLERGIRASFLGSTQKDPTVVQRLERGELDVLFLTVERFFTGTGVDSIFLRMATEGKIGLIAVDEVHLVCSWKSFRFVQFCCMYLLQHHLYVYDLLLQARLRETNQAIQLVPRCAFNGSDCHCSTNSTGPSSEGGSQASYRSVFSQPAKYHLQSSRANFHWEKQR